MDIITLSSSDDEDKDVSSRKKEEAKGKEKIPERKLKKRKIDSDNVKYICKQSSTFPYVRYEKNREIVEKFDGSQSRKSFKDPLTKGNKNSDCLDKKKNTMCTDQDTSESFQEDKACAEALGNQLNINSLPEYIFIEIFKYFSHNELGQISRVCKTWNRYAKSSVLWKKVDVKIFSNCGSQRRAAFIFSEKLSPCVTQIKIDFAVRYFWTNQLDFEEFCVILREKCPQLHTLILHHAQISISLPSVIHLCTEYLPDLVALILNRSQFGDNCSENTSVSKIEVLGVYPKGNSLESSTRHLFPRMPNLKKISVFDMDDWYRLENLQQLQLLNSNICSTDFRMLQMYAMNMTELFLCWSYLCDDDFVFSNAAFPVLKTVCIKHCSYVTCVGIVSLVQSCKSLQNVYVATDRCKCYAKHPFVVANPSKLEIVKSEGNNGLNDDHEKVNKLFSLNEEMNLCNHYNS